jgi:hypothetical protein
VVLVAGGRTFGSSATHAVLLAPRVLSSWRSSAAKTVILSHPCRFSQGFVGQFGLWDWVQQAEPQTPLRNYSGGPSAFAGRLNASTVLAFLAALDELTAGRQPWHDVAPLWQELFWVAPPDPQQQGSRCNTTAADAIPIGLGFWSQDYDPAQCDANVAALSVAWDKTHAEWRAGLCASPAGHVALQCVTPLDPPPPAHGMPVESGRFPE